MQTGASPLSPDDVCVIEGLTGRTDLNGTRVKLLSFKAKTSAKSGGRWAVKPLDGGQGMKLKASNLKRVEDLSPNGLRRITGTRGMADTARQVVYEATEVSEQPREGATERLRADTAETSESAPVPKTVAGRLSDRSESTSTKPVHELIASLPIKSQQVTSDAMPKAQSESHTAIEVSSTQQTAQAVSTQSTTPDAMVKEGAPADAKKSSGVVMQSTALENAAMENVFLQAVHCMCPMTS